MEEKTVENGWSMLMKFGSKKNLKKLREGQLYMKNLKYYVDLEKTTDDEDVGDKYDGQMVLRDVKISMVTVDTNHVDEQLAGDVLTIKYSSPRNSWKEYTTSEIQF